MATYAIGDIQGCYDALLFLLDKIAYNEHRDKIWFAGDLVNRGSKSVDVLRHIRGMGHGAITVLGNHDLHLLAVAYGYQQRRRHDTFTDVLNADDRDELLVWLRNRPLIHTDPILGYTLVHAGLPPQWSIEQAHALASEVEAILQDSSSNQLFEHMYGDEPLVWSEDHSGWDRYRFIINCLTRIRYCDGQGSVALKNKGAPGTQKPGYFPWFEIAERKSRKNKILFGHWATLGDYPVPDNVYPLDTGCVWGGELTALCLDDGRRFSVPCNE